MSETVTLPAPLARVHVDTPFSNRPHHEVQLHDDVAVAAESADRAVDDLMRVDASGLIE